MNMHERGTVLQFNKPSQPDEKPMITGLRPIHYAIDPYIWGRCYVDQPVRVIKATAL